MISVVIPYHDMANGAFFLKRAIDSVMSQTYKDYEIVLVKEGKMAENTNAGIRKAREQIVKILYMDDYLAHPNSLRVIHDAFTKNPNIHWLATACNHDDGVNKGNVHYATWDNLLFDGVNTIGSPSVIAFKNLNSYYSRYDDNVFFDEKLSWMLDVDLYTRLFKKHGKCAIIDDVNVTIGIGSHQMTNILTNSEKELEFKYLLNKYER
jgi:glycosyltransferase involved in cell wall biosynthesis